MRRTLVVSVLLIFVGSILIACGSTAEELRPTFEPTATFDFTLRNQIQATRDAIALAEAENNAQDDGVAVAQEPSEIETETEAPPTEAPTEEATETPVTPEPTEEATEEPTEEATLETELSLQERFPDLPANADPTTGEILFSAIVEPGGTRNCTTCHEVAEPIPGTGPYLYGIANRAGERVEGETAVEYLFTSIKYPNDYISPDQGDSVWAEGVMPQNWSEVLTDDDIYHIVAYLLTLDQAE